MKSNQRTAATGERRRPYLTTREVARILGVTAQSVINWTNSGLLPCLKTPGIGNGERGHRRFTLEVVQRFKEEQMAAQLPLTEA